MPNVPVLLVAGRKHIYACVLTYVLTLTCITWHLEAPFWGLGPQSFYGEKDNCLVFPWLWGRLIPACEQEHAHAFPVYTHTHTLKTQFKFCTPFLRFPTVIAAAESKCMPCTTYWNLVPFSLFFYDSLAHTHSAVALDCPMPAKKNWHTVSLSVCPKIA